MAETESALYTVTLRTLLENSFEIFDVGAKEYPIFLEGHRVELNDKIKDHYYFHEIGFEVEERFKHRLNTRLREIMPLYNQMYSTELLIQNPMLSFSKSTSSTTVIDEDRVETKRQVTDQDSTQATDSLNKELEVTSKTPKNLIAQVDLQGDVYANDAVRKENVIDEDVVGTVDESINNDDIFATDVTTTITITDSGHQISEAQLLEDYRATFLNIDLLIIDELDDLFMGLM